VLSRIVVAGVLVLAIATGGYALGHAGAPKSATDNVGTAGAATAARSSRSGYAAGYDEGRRIGRRAYSRAFQAGYRQARAQAP